jgi:hypothetical protein
MAYLDTACRWAGFIVITGGSAPARPLVRNLFRQPIRPICRGTAGMTQLDAGTLRRRRLVRSGQDR